MNFKICVLSLYQDLSEIWLWGGEQFLTQFHSSLTLSLPLNSPIQYLPHYDNPCAQLRLICWLHRHLIHNKKENHFPKKCWTIPSLCEACKCFCSLDAALVFLIEDFKIIILLCYAYAMPLCCCSLFASTLQRPRTAQPGSPTNAGALHENTEGNRWKQNSHHHLNCK